MKVILPFALAAVLSGAVLPLAAQAQCTPKMQGFNTGPIDINDSTGRSLITTIMPFDDGTGPGLIVAGRFSLPTSTSMYTQVAWYQNGQWTPMTMPEELPFEVPVNDLAVQDFSSVGGPGRSIYAMRSNGRVYRRTGTQWTLVGSQQSTSGAESLLSTSDSQGPVLLMTRKRLQNDGLPRVLAWRGSGDWTAYGTALNNGAVYRLRTIDDGSGPATFAVGIFSDPGRGIKDIAKFVDGEWAPVPFPSDSTVQGFGDITTYDDGTHGSEPYLSAIRYNGGGLLGYGSHVYRRRGGEWQVIEAGGIVNDGSTPISKFLKLNEGSGESLYLGGYLRAGGQTGLLRLTSSGWQPFLYLHGSGSASTGAAFAIARYEDGGVDRIFVGGDFKGFSSAYSASDFSENRAYSLLQSSTDAPLGYITTALGVGEFVDSSSLAYGLSTLDLPEGPRLLMSGNFQRAGGLRANGAALFDGEAFTSLSYVGFDPTIVPSLQSAVYVPFNGEPRILAGVWRGGIGPVVYWDGSQWQRLAQQPPGSDIYTLAVLNDEPLALTVNKLSVYRNGSWQELASVTEGYAGVVGDLGQGTRFYFLGNGTAGSGVYQFDGQSVTFVGATSNSSRSITIHDDGAGPRLYVGGLAAPGVVRFNGTSFEPLPGGDIVVETASIALGSYDDGRGPALYAAGGFATAGGQSVNGFARWSNDQWEPVTPYVPPVPSTYRMKYASLCVFKDRLYVAGDFTSIGGVNADHLAFVEPCRVTCASDYNHDGDSGTDLDIEAFFACLGGQCCSRCTSDFNADGDFGTDADIESFFRVLAGGEC